MPIKVIAAGAFGALAFAAFHAAILGLFFFLRDDSLLSKFSRSEFGLAEALWNLGLIFFFTLPHSFLLTPPGRKVTRALPPKLHMTAYSLHASLSLMLMYVFWRPGEVLFEFSGGWRTVLDALSALSWSLMAWAIYATGALRQMGVEQCLAYMRERPLSYRLPYSGPYRFMRHPIYVSFFGMIWFCPQ